MVVRVAQWAQPFRGLRAIDPARDLGQIADLVERSFAGEPDGAGRKAVADLRRLDRQRAVLWLLSRTSQEFGDAFSGYVWVENDRVVGNTNITREDTLGLRWLLSSVAVHPAHRRRGIARAMVEASVEHARERGGHWVELLVQVGNQGATALYEQAGFAPLETVATLRAESVPQTPPPASPVILPIQPRDEGRLIDLARDSTPPVVQRVRPIRADRFAGDWRRGWLHLFGAHPRREWWGVREGERFVAAVRVGREPKAPSTLELMVAPDARGRFESGLVQQALYRLADRPRLPVIATISGRDPEAIPPLLASGFRVSRTLTRMAKELAPRSGRGEGV